ncbi:MAG: GEVED domain-containing protein [Bacteroidia bacterium]
MRKSLFLSLLAGLFLFTQSAYSQVTYLDMMDDNAYNVYEVIKAAEAYFETHPKGKGSGWKDFERWRERVEPMFYPSGDRRLYNEDKVMKGFEAMRKSRQSQKWNAASGYYWEPQGPDVAENYFASAYASGVGRVEAVWGGSVNGDTVYLGSRSGGFWKTIDGGATWRSTTQDLAAVGVIDIDVRHDRHNEIFIVSRNASGQSRGLWKSVDYGETWTQTSLNTNNRNIKKLAITEQQPNTMYASADNGLYRSRDGGNTWTRVMNVNIRDFEVSVFDPETLFIINQGNNNRVNISTDGGTSIPQFTDITGNGASPRIRITKAEPGYVYIQSNNGVWRSTDTAKTFTRRGGSPANMAFGVSDTDAELLIWGGLNQYASFDGGINNQKVCDWVDPTSANYVHADGRVIGSWNGQIYFGTDGYLGTSNNGMNWSIVNFRGTPIREFYRIGLSITDASYIIGGSQDNGTSIRRDTAWYEWYGADGMECHVDNNNSAFWFGTVQYGSLIYGEQDGQQRVGRRPHNDGAWITPSVLDPSNDNTIFIAYDTLFKSNDNGANWKMISDWGSEGNMNDLTISPVDSNLLYITKGNQIWRSFDNGVNWRLVVNGLSNQTISRVACHPDNTSIVSLIVRGTSNGNKVFTSNNAGTTWTNISAGLPNTNGQTIVYEEGPDERLYIGMDAGIYYRDRFTPNWTLYMDSFPAVQVRDLQVHLGAHQLVAATWGRGAWATNLVGTKDHPQVVKINFTPEPTLTTPTNRDSVHARTEVRDPNGTITEVKLYWGVDGFTYPNIIALTNQQGDIYETASGIPPAAIGSQIYLRFMAVDNDDDTTWTERIVYRLNEAKLCAASGSAGTGSDFINYVSLGPVGFANLSGKDAYGDFRTNYYPEVNKGENYDLEVRLNSSFPPDSVFAWVDWNNNFTFEQQEQIIMSKLNNTSTSTASIVIPDEANLDTVIMRVRNIYSTRGHVADPCNNYPGEVEDYSLIVKDRVSSVEPGMTPIANRVFPNPTRHQITIEHLNTQPLSVAVYDLFGKAMTTTIVEQSSTETVLDMQGLPAGVYLLKLKSSTSNQIVKVMVE